MQGDPISGLINGQFGLLIRRANMTETKPDSQDKPDEAKPDVVVPPPPPPPTKKPDPWDE
jgi:hypothetical protein